MLFPCQTLQRPRALTLFANNNKYFFRCALERGFFDEFTYPQSLSPSVPQYELVSYKLNAYDQC
jgi:hypothetical protein